ncbi:MAG TPA: thymidylate synthase [Acidimicrobiales bacterium]|nr:thymidylate synthase [Acidimicrobiales bacterium]
MNEPLLKQSRLHVDAPGDISTRTIGDAWIEIAARILAEGRDSMYDGLAIRELIMTTLHVSHPHSRDPLIDRLADPERMRWMHANFTDPAQVVELGGADSYATRLYNYDHQSINQIEWVIEKLKRDVSSRSATITTFQPLTDTTYIPCISLLDFFIQGRSLDLVVYAHSIDFGTKGFANLVELAFVQEHVATELAMEMGHLTLIVKSAHIYNTDRAAMNDVLALASDQR